MRTFVRTVRRIILIQTPALSSVCVCVCVCGGGGGGGGGIGSLHNTYSLSTGWWKDSQRSEPFKIHTSTFMAQKFVLWVF